MPQTIAQAVAAIERLVAPLVTYPAPAPPAAVPDALIEPIAIALDACGAGAADPTAPADADMALLPDAAWVKFLAIARLEAVEAQFLRLTAGGTMVQFPSYTVQHDVASVRTVVEDLRKKVANLYGYGAARLSSGSIAMPRNARRPRHWGYEV